MTSGSDSILAIPQNFGADSKIKGLKVSNNNNNSNNNTPNPTSPENSIVWKDLGQYLESLNEIPIENSQLKNNLNLKQPLNSTINYRVCTICNRPILVHHLPKHIKSCLEMKQRKEQEQLQQKQHQQSQSIVSTPQDAPTPKATNTKKRKLQDIRDQTPNNNEMDTPQPSSSNSAPKTKKSKKDSTTATSKSKKKSTARQKGPVDVERQCGVALPNGGFCARSLTCKTHSMGAKRAVPGRSASYDTLLAAYQHKNQVKIAGQAAKAQAEKDELIHGGPTALDSDEETQQVLSGVSRSFPLPLERKNLVPTRIRSNFLRMREMFAGAILPRITNSNGVGGINGRTALLDIDRSNEHLFLVRAPQRIMLNKNNIQQQQQQQQQQTQTQQQAQVQQQAQTQQQAQQQQQQAAAIAQNRNQMLAQQQAAALRAQQMQQQVQQQQQKQ